MTISVTTRQRALSLFNEDKSQKIEVYPIQLYVNDRGKVYYITTGLTTENPYQKNEIFNDRGVSRRMNEAKTKRLKDLVETCNLWALQNPDETIAERKKNLTAIVKGSEDMKLPNNLADFMRKYVEANVDNEKTRRVYFSTIKKLNAFDPKATFDSVDEVWLKRWENWMKEDGLAINGLGKHMRNLKAVYNWARKKKWTQNYPFDFYVIKVEHSFEISLTAQEFADLRDWKCEPWQERYRDMFVLMVYLGGLDIVDLAGLKDTDLTKGRLHFFRTKNVGRGTSVEVEIPVMEEAMALIKKYKGKTDGNLLNIMDGRIDYQSYSSSMLDCLKTIGWTEKVADKVGKKRKLLRHPMFKDIQVKTARRTFSTIMRRLRVPEVLVGMCMGHAWSAKNTTQIYERFTYEDQEDVMRELIDHLNSFKGRGKEEIFEELRQKD